MSIFGKIASAIFGVHAAHAGEASPTSVGMPSNVAVPPAPAVVASAATPAPAASPTAAPAASVPGAAPKVTMAGVDVAEILDGVQDEQDEDLDWRRSIVDLMKLLKLDSGLSARKELATELKYTGNMSDSASMNVWLHKQVMTKLAENGGTVPNDLKH